jgi:hypothetical protein
MPWTSSQVRAREAAVLVLEKAMILSGVKIASAFLKCYNTKRISLGDKRMNG